MKNLGLLLLLLPLVGCDPTDSSNRIAVAKTYNYVLYQSDLVGVVPEGSSSEDSLIILNNYIRKWTKEMALLHRAEISLPQDQSEINERIANYRKDLIMYEFEKALVDQRLDTVVSDEDIEKYFADNPENFNQRNYLVKAMYLKVTKNSPQLEYIQKWYRSHKADDLKAIQEYALEHGTEFYYEPRKWIEFGDIQAKIPIQIPNEEDLILERRHFTHDDGRYFYFLNILGYKETDSDIPNDLVRKRILAIIINKRKSNLVKQIRQEVYQDALQGQNIEIIGGK